MSVVVRNWVSIEKGRTIVVGLDGGAVMVVFGGAGPIEVWIS